MRLRELNTERKIWAIAFILTFIVLIILLTLIPVSKWLWLGWLYGCLGALAGFLVSTLLLNPILNRLRSKAAGFWASMGRTLANFVLQGGLFILLVVFDNLYIDNKPLGGGLSELVNGIVPFPTYIAGLGVVTIASIASLLFENKKKEV